MTKSTYEPALVPAPMMNRPNLCFILNLLLVALWLRLFWPIFEYMSIIFAREDFRTNQIVLLIILLLIGLQIRTHGFQLQLTEAPQRRPLPLLLLMGSTTAFTLVERYLDINTISAMLFVISGYGLLGLWMDREPWRQRLPAAFMLIGVLPLGEHLQTFIGYPMRIMTAKWVGAIVQMVGVPTVGIDTILVFENGVSQVDLPCSGVKSLWTGALFLTAATWIERRPMTIGWWLIGLVMAGLLFLANFGRVLLLVLVGQVGGFELVARMIHVPLGVLGFVTVCGITLGLLRLGKAPNDLIINVSRLPVPCDGQKPLWIMPALIIWLLGLILVYAPRPLTGVAEAKTPWHFPEVLVTEPSPLSATEAEWFIKDGADSVERVRFEWHGITGSMILVTSRTWRAHHRPERCFEVYGLTLDHSKTHLTSHNQPVRSVGLGNGSGGDNHLPRYSAVYWFQSAEQITDDYGVRIWSDLELMRQRWVLVSILFDGEYELREPAVDELIQSLQETVAGRL